MMPLRGHAPLSEAVLVAVARLVDDAQAETREPSHSAIQFAIDRAGLSAGDPNRSGRPVGKAKRVRATLSWALDNSPEAGERLVADLIALTRACGGFRDSSSNYVGQEAICNAMDAFNAEGYELTTDGILRPRLLDTLTGAELTDALDSYVRRATRGAEDAALVTGTGKDLLEATAAHVLMERYGDYSSQRNFPTLLGQAFVALNIATPHDTPVPGEPAHRRLERAMYELGCAVNGLRNKEGTGHGRPWLPSVTDVQARLAIEAIGTIAGYLLRVHKHLSGS